MKLLWTRRTQYSWKLNVKDKGNTTLGLILRGQESRTRFVKAKASIRKSELNWKISIFKILSKSSTFGAKASKG